MLVSIQLPDAVNIHHTTQWTHPRLYGVRNQALCSTKTTAVTVGLQSKWIWSAHENHQKLSYRPTVTLHIHHWLRTQPFSNHDLWRVIRGKNPFHGEPNQNMFLSNTHGLRTCILLLLDVNTSWHAPHCSTSCIAHIRFLRASKTCWTEKNVVNGYIEFAQYTLTSKSIQIEEFWLLLTLSGSKMDPFQISITITLFISDDITCRAIAIWHQSELCLNWTPIAHPFVCHLHSVSNGSGPSLRVRVRVQTEPLPNWGSGSSINPNCPLGYGSMVNSQPVWIGRVVSGSHSGSIYRFI